MGRKAKYSKELKLEIVKRYLKGESASALANEYALLKRGAHTIRDWVNKYESLDFIVYNFRRQFARIHEIKGTTNNDICMATITRSEEKVLDEVLASKNKIYEVDRIKLDPNLKGIDDYSAFRFFSKGNLDYLDINGYRKGGVGMVMGHDEKTMLGSNFAHVFETFANNQGPTRTR